MKNYNLLYISITSSILVILYKFFKWELIDLFTMFLILPIIVLVYGFFIFTIILAITQIFRKKDWKPIIVQCATIVILFLVPFNQIIIDIDYKWNKSKREQVITMVNENQLKPNVSYNDSLIHLPNKLQHLSSGGGDIIVEQAGNHKRILFFTFRGILDNFSGFVYSPTDEMFPRTAFDSDFKDIQRIEKHWYYVVSY